MKILFCDNSYRNLLNFRGDVILHLIEQGHEVVLLTPPDQKEKEDTGYKFIPVHMERCGMNPLKDFKYFLNILKVYKNENPDYIFHYTIKPNIYGSIAAKILSIPSTVMVTGLGYSFNHNDLRSKIAKIMYKFALGLNENILVLNSGNLQKMIDLNMVKPSSNVILLEGGEGINLDKFK